MAEAPHRQQNPLAPLDLTLRLQGLIRTFDRISLSLEFCGQPLSFKLRELLILQIAWSAGSEHLWNAHQEVASSLGVTDLQIAALQQQQIQAFVFDTKEKSLLQFLLRLRGSRTISRKDVDELRQYFDDREIVEILATESLYRTLVMFESAFEVRIDADSNIIN